MMTGEAVPMAHQAEDVDRLSVFPRVNVWNGLGTGKTLTAVWWASRLWMRGVIDEIVLVVPSMCLPDWHHSFAGLGMDHDLVDFYDCRPPDAGIVEDMLTSLSRAPGGTLRVMCTTYGGMRSMLAEKVRRKNVVKSDHPVIVHARGRRVGLICDEAQAAALPTSAQGVACRGFGSAARAVASVTATPIGRPEHLRLWGLTKLVRPDILRRLPVDMYRPTPRSAPRPSGAPGSFNAFKYRFAFLHDPMERNSRAFSVARAFPVNVHSDRIQREVLDPMSPFTVRRRKEDCLALPPKVRMSRTYRLSSTAQRIFDSLVEDDRAVLEDGYAVVPSNVLEERLRTLELSGGYLEGRPVHDGKLGLLRDVLSEIDEGVGESAPRHVWASRSREVIACAIVASGAKPRDALLRASEVYPPGSTGPVTSEYRREISALERRGVGVIHGPTQSRDRDRIQDAWRSGSIKTVVAHPGVAGAGLNWQHSKAAVYYSPPIGTIARRQSEDRVHRKGLRHEALIYDLTMEDGPDRAVVMAHVDQRNAAQAMLNWMTSRIYG